MDTTRAVAIEDWWACACDRITETNEALFGERERCARLAEEANQPELAAKIRKGGFPVSPAGLSSYEGGEL